MKKYLSILMLAGLTLFAACSSDDDDKTVYTVTFETDGGTPVPSVQQVEEGNAVSAPSTNPTKSGYVFVYWHLSGATTAYNFQTPVNGNITLHAKWQEEAQAEYWQVTWNLNGGSWSSGDNHATQVLKGGTLTEPDAPTKLGNTFEGWYKEAALTNKINFPYDVSNLTANFTLYAKWATEGGGTDDPHKTDIYLQLASYYLAYTIQITEQYKKGQRPSYIENEKGQSIVIVNYNPNGTMNYLDFRLPYILSVICYNNQPALTFRASDIEYGRNAFSALNNGTYDYDRDPGIILSYYGSFSGSSVFTSLANLRILANNNGITEDVYSKIIFPDGCYKLLVFSSKNEKIFGKYVGYSSSTGKSFTYWCIDSNDSSFGKSFTMSIPFDI